MHDERSDASSSTAVEPCDTLAPVPRWARRQARGTYAGFFAFGASYGGWEARMPELKRNLSLDNRSLGLLMGGMALAQLASSWAAGPLTRAVGARPAQALMALCFPLSIAALAATHSMLEAQPAMLLIGASGGIYDNLINTAAGVAEAGGLASAISTAHGFASIGSLVGGGAAAGAEHVGLPLMSHLFVAGLALALLGLWGAQQVQGEPRGPIEPDDDTEGNLASVTPPAHAPRHGPSVARSAVAYRLAAINLASSLAEGALYDWTSIYLRDVRGAEPSVAAIGYVGVVGSMAASRIGVSPRLLHLPLRGVLVGAASLAGLSMVTTLLASDQTLALVGLGATGATLGIITPRITLEMSRRFPEQRNAAMAMMATGQSCGFFSGPPLIGLAAGRFGLAQALGVVPALSALAALLALSPFGAAGAQNNARPARA